MLEPVGARPTAEPTTGGSPTEAGRSRQLATWRHRHLLERKLHDGAAMRASALVLQLGVFRELIPEGHGQLLEGIRAVQDELHAVLEELRDIAAEIYPPLLDEAGLVPALRELAARLDVPVQIEAGPGAATRRFGSGPEGAVYFGLVAGLAAHPTGTDQVEIVVSGGEASPGCQLVISVTGVGPEVGEALLDCVRPLGGTVTVGSTTEVRVPCE